MAEEKNEIVEGAKSVAQDVVTTFGLIELVIGGVGLYGFWLLFKPGEYGLLPKTGRDFIDAGLLGFAAVIAGKFIYLISAFFMGFILASSRSSRDQLQTSLYSYTEQIYTESIAAGSSPVQTAELLLSASPKYAVDLKNNRNKILVAYGIALISILYIIYFFSQNQIIAGILCALLFLIFGFLGIAEQKSQLQFMSEALKALLIERKLKQKIAEQTTTAPPASSSNNYTITIQPPLG